MADSEDYQLRNQDLCGWEGENPIGKKNAGPRESSDRKTNDEKNNKRK